MTLLLGLAYALLFVLVGARRPQWALIAIFATTPLQFDLGSDALRYSITEINLLLTLPLLALRLREARYGVSLGPLTLPICAYLLVCALSTFINWQGSDAIVSWVQMFLYVVVTVLVFAHLCPPEQLRRVPYYLVAVCVLWSLFGMKVNFDFMFLKKNSFGSSLAIGFLCAYDSWLARGYLKIPFGKDKVRLALIGAMLIIFTGLMMTLSRGSWLGTIGGLIVIAVLRGNVKPLLKVGAVSVPIMLIVWFNLPPELKEYTVSFDADQHRNIALRLMTLQQTQQLFHDNPIFGAGLGLRKNIDATNVAWLALAETGILGALAFAWIFWNFARLAWRARRILPPSDPRFTLLTLGAAMMTCRLLHGMVDHYWTRGALTNAWAGYGMILCFCRIPIEARARQMHQLAQQKRAAHALASAQQRATRRELAGR